MEKYTISATGIINYVWDVRTALRRYAADERTAENELAPLVWYLNTGRASCQFLRQLLTTKPYMVARRLHGGGSSVEALRRVFHLIKYQPSGT